MLTSSSKYSEILTIGHQIIDNFHLNIVRLGLLRMRSIIGAIVKSDVPIMDIPILIKNTIDSVTLGEENDSAHIYLLN